MNNRNVDKIKLLEQDYIRFRKTLPRKIAITAVNFFKRNFRVGGFVDKPFQKWKTPSHSRKKGKTLVRSGNLRRSIKKIRVTPNKIVVGVTGNIPYAQIHNEGGTIPITPKMRRYFWAMYKKTEDPYYRNMAMTKKTHIEIPKRQFIGDSKALEVSIERLILKELKALQ